MNINVEFTISDEAGAELLPKLIETILVAHPDAWQLKLVTTRPDPSLQTLIPQTDQPEKGSDA